MTTATKYNLLPEWAPQDAVMLAWPHQGTDWADDLPAVVECYKQISTHILDTEGLIVVTPDVAQAKRDLGPLEQQVRFFQLPTNDTWARDFGPITVLANGAPTPLDYCFNAWGMKFAANHDNQVNGHLAARGLFAQPLISHQDFVLEGGSIESDGHGTILTTTSCLMAPNRGKRSNREYIEKRLKHDFGALQILWLEGCEIPGDDTDGHIDTLARFTDEHTIACCAGANQLRKMTDAQGHPYQVVELPMPDPITDTDGSPLPATYANFLILNDQVLVPIYGQEEEDTQALGIIASLFPNRKITGIDCNALVRQHGSLHCVTMQFPQNTLK